MSERSSREAALFLQLLLGLQAAAMQAMGKLMNPLTRKVERNLDAARDAIDTLAALEARTEGKLEPDEARVLKQVLTDLRMNYVEEARKGSSAVPADAGSPASEGSEPTSR